MRKTTRILSIVLVLLMLVGLMPAAAFADDSPWARVTYANGTFEDCSSFPQAWNKATASNNATVTLLNNWDGGRFIVPEGKTVTLELNGWVLTRDRSTSTSDGEVLYVSKNATLKVYGGTQSNPAANAEKTHNVWVYRANGDRYGYSRDKVTLRGGIINGGNSSDAGGGIHMKESAKVYLYHVTIAGNKAAAKTVEFGDGGGVEMDCKYGYLYMEDSQIIYNAARYDGGGVHVDSDYCRIDMVRSRIDHNVADDNGGGIYVDGDNFVLKGDAKQIMDPEAAISTYQIKDWTGVWNYFPDVNALGSSISYNCVFDTEDGGGGIYMDNEYGLIDGVNFFGNITTDDSGSGTGDGGAVYLDEEEITIRNCNIMRNKADKLGGGIYVRGDDHITDYDDNTVDSCTIYKNLGWDTNGAGGGIYIYKYCDLNIAGKLIVRENVSQSFAKDNVYLSTDGDAVDAYLIPSLSPGADVHVRISKYGTWGHGDQITRDPGTYDETLFSYDNNESHHIGWNSDWNERHLMIVDGAKPAKVETVVFTPDPGTRTQIVSGGFDAPDGRNYELIKGIFSYPSFPDDSADIENIFYYSDGFFAGDTNTYNPQLATASMCLAGAAGYSNEYGKDDRTGGMSSDYLDKSQNFRQFVSDIGCADADIFVNDFNTRKPDADTIGVGIASKPIFGTKTLVIIGVRGMGYEKEWISNMTLGAEGEADGWASAASQVMAELDAYLTRKGIDGSSGDTIFWIAGYSRAGATSNLTAKRIVDKYDNAGTHTFAYPLEAPMGGLESEKIAGHNYNCIHNVINQNDIVPWTGTTEMGFIRYGVDHYVPGSPTLKETPSDGGDNNKIPEDNTAWDVKGNTNGHGGSEQYANTDYYKQKVKMVAQLKAINPDIVFDDYFHRATIRYLTGGEFQTTTLIRETGDHGDIMPDTEGFVKKFFSYLQENAFKYKTDGTEVGAPYNNPRAFFATYEIDNHKTFQQAAAAAAGVIFGLPADRKEGLTGSFDGLMGRLEGKSSFWMHLDTSGITGKDLIEDIKNVWKQLATPDSTAISKGARSIKDFLTDEEFKALNDSYMSLLFPILCFTAKDWSDNGQDIVGTAAYNIPRIIANHYPEVTHAWLRSYDDLYANDGSVPVMMDPTVKKAPSAAALCITHKDGTTDTVILDSDKIASIGIDDTVSMIPSDPDDADTGEAIYYQFTDGPIYYWRDRGTHAYSEPLRIADMIESHSLNGAFRFKVVAAHNGTKLPAVNVQLQFEGNATLSVPMIYSDDGYQYQELPLQLANSMTIGAIVPVVSDGLPIFGSGEEQGLRFKEWQVFAYDAETHQIGVPIGADQYIEYFGAGFDAFNPVTEVTNKKSVSARFVPVYEKIVSSIDIRFDGGRSVSGLEGMYYLPAHIEWEETGAEASERQSTIFWTFDAAAVTFNAEFSITLTGLEAFDDVPHLEFDVNSLSSYIVSMDSDSVNGTVSEKTLTVTATFIPYLPPEEYDYGWYMEDQAVVAYDLNLNRRIGEYHFQNVGTVTAPFIEDMEFVRWQDGSTDPTAAVTNVEMKAYYRPIVNTVTVVMNQAPAAGENMPALDSVRVTVTNVWRIDNVLLTWSPAASAANYDTVYTARITVNKAGLAGTDLNDPNSGSVSLAGAFALAENLTVAVKDTNGNALTVRNHVFTETDDELILDLVFEKTAKQAVVGFANVSIAVAYGSTESEILAALPTEVYAYLASGQMVSVPVEWTGTAGIDTATQDAQSVTALGSYMGEEYSVAEGVSLTASVTIAEAERTATPAAVPGSGSYTGIQTILLTADEDAVIRYALREVNVSDYYTETTDPDTGETIRMLNPDLVLTPPVAADYQAYDEPITLCQYGKVVLLYAYAEKAGLRESSVAMFRYELTKPEVMKLEAKDPKIAEDGNIECWYSTESRCVGEDDSGEPVYEQVPDRYYADEDCTALLDYNTEVRIPAFIATVHPADAGDAIAACVAEYDGFEVVYDGFTALGVQAIGADGQAARVLTVLDARIIGAATDYGYLFAADDSELTYDSAQYRYSCEGTANTLYGGEDYLYVTAKLAGGFLDEGMRAVFYVKLENGTDYIYTDAVVCTPSIEATSDTDDAKDNVTVGLPDGFYLIGPDWTVKAIDPENVFTANPNVQGEYMLNTTLSEGDEIKVVRVADGAIVGWYPNGMDNQYHVDLAHAGAVTIYFRESYNDGWSEFGGYFYIAADTSVPSFKTHSLVLSGQIGVNFYMDLPAIEGVNWTESYMTFEILHGTVTERDDYDPAAMNKKATYYSFTAYVNSIQMAEPITATFHYTQNGEEKTISDTYSIRQYLGTFDTAVANGTITDAKTIDLVHALADYGHYVQIFLADAKGWTLGEDYAEMDRFYATGYDIEAIKTALSGYAIGIEVNGADITKFTFATVLDSATTIRMQFTVPKGYSGAFTAETSDGTPVTVKKNGTRYTVEIADIPAHNLSKTFEVTITTENGSATVNVSALSYVKIALDAYTDANAQNAMAAIYTYAKAAEALKTGN